MSVWVPQPGANFTPVEVPRWGEHKDHTNWLNGHEERLNGYEARLSDHDGKIADLYKKLGENKAAHNQRMDNIDGWIKKIETRVDGMPQTLRVALEQVVKGTFDDKLKCFATQVEVLREERKQIFAQLEELRKERDESKSQLDALRSQSAEVKAQLESLSKQLSEAKKIEDEMKDDFSMQVAEFKMAVPVPKKFAKFLFVKAEPDEKKED